MNWGTNPELHPELNLTLYHRTLNDTLKQQALQALVPAGRQRATAWVRRMFAALVPAPAKPQPRQCVHVCHS